MARRIAERPNEEIWELTVPGRVAVTIHDARGNPRDITAKGVGQRLRLTEEERLLLQEQFLDPENDFFVNGMLVRVDSRADKSEVSSDQLTDDDLRSLFGLPFEEFKSIVDGLGQVPVRRLSGLAIPSGASVLQANYLTEQIAERWPVTSGDTPTYREMMAAR